MLTSSALVLMMTIPGLALFYSGMVRKKNVLATLMQSFVIVCLVTIIGVMHVLFVGEMVTWIGFSGLIIHTSRYLGANGSAGRLRGRRPGRRRGHGLGCAALSVIHFLIQGAYRRGLSRRPSVH